MSFISVPNSFTQNTLIESSKMNANFQAIVDALSGETASLDIDITGALDVGGAITGLSLDVAGEVEGESFSIESVSPTLNFNDSNGADFTIQVQSDNMTFSTNGSGRVIIPGYPYTLDVNITLTGVSSSSLTALYSYSVPANTLVANGDYLEGTLNGVLAANDNDKRFVMSVGGNTVLDSSTVDLDGASGWRIDYNITRITSTTVLFNGLLTANIGAISSTGAASTQSTNGWYSFTKTFLATVSDLNANTLSVQMSAQGSTNNDIDRRVGIIRVVQR
jgi:hypothetical protein